MIQPVLDRVLIRMAHKQAKVGNLFIPSGARYELNQGRIDGVGPDVKYVALGDHVIFSEHAGLKVGDSLIIVEEDDILAVLED